MPSPSHGIWNRCLLEALAEKGHEVTALTAYFGENATNISEQFAAILPKFKAPIVILNAFADGFWHWDLLGVENSPAVFTHPLMSFSSPMNFLERMQNFVTLYYEKYIYQQYLLRQQALADKVFGEAAGKIQDAKNLYDLFLINSGPPGLDLSRSLPPNYKEVGCIQCRPNDSNKLQREVKEFLDGAKDGFVYFSLGTNIKSSLLPKHVMNDILKTFDNLKLKVLWKFENDDMPGKPVNVMINKWLSQQDVIGHKNCRLFITHGGRLSIQEAAYHGVPLVIIPFYIDQHKNGEVAAKSEIGVTINFLEFSRERFETAIRKVLDDPKFKRKAQKQSEIAQDTMSTPLETAVFWIEYVARHKGAKHLRPASLELNFVQRHCLDVIAFLIASVILLLFTMKIMIVYFII
ncbi:UDP-glucosyltransferase 2-like, partial [Neocloeon triangulifer]|uniref:UDP-glucosyltransferase 2-like n=1 Tax=Neocloeon triangulifer TaxID=2078957 RepID=UPI00286F737E